MAISKIIYKTSDEDTGTVWMDVTQKTVTAGSMLSGTTAMKNDGTDITGNIATKTSSNMTVSGATVTAPAGYYASDASKSVSSGSATTPATTITANPSISVNSSTGVITATASATKSVTPTVSAGYVSSGTAGTITVSGSNTSSLTTQAAQTIHPSTTAQSIASGKYLTGTQTISAVTLENLTAENIKKDVVVKIGDASDDDCVASVTGTYEGGGGGTTWETVYQGSLSVTSYEDGYYYGLYNPFNETIPLNSVWRVTWNNVEYNCTATVDGTPYNLDDYIIGNPGIIGLTSSVANEPFAIARVFTDRLFVAAAQSGTYSIKLEKQVSGGGGSTLITKTITANGTYDAEDDDADGYSEVTVAIPAGTAGTPTATKGTVSNHSISVTPSVTNTAGVISGGTINGTAVTVSASELVSGSETKTSNGTYDVTNLAQLVVNVSGGSGLVYETGTYTPSSNVAQPTISFSGTHSDPPVFVAISDTSAASGITSNSNTSWSIVDYWRINAAGYPYSTSATRYAVVYYGYRGSNNTTIASVQTQYNSDNTSTDSTSYYRYWATASNFKPSSNSTSRYWRSGRTYKWIAVWK